MVNKSIGYLSCALGIFSIGCSSEVFKEIISKALPFVTKIQNRYFLLAGITLTILGVVLILKGEKKQQPTKELPIYQGKEIVGYRRNK